MNVNTKNNQMEYYPCPNYGMIYRSDIAIIQVREKHLKNDQELKFTIQNMPLLNNLQFNNVQKYKMI